MGMSEEGGVDTLWFYIDWRCLREDRYGNFLVEGVDGCFLLRSVCWYKTVGICFLAFIDVFQ
jgi:hypothetical protein